MDLKKYCDIIVNFFDYVKYYFLCIILQIVKHSILEFEIKKLSLIILKYKDEFNLFSK